MNSRRTTAQLMEDAVEIWKAGVCAVDSQQLVADSINVAGDELQIVDASFSLASLERIIVVGAGKAGAGMASGVEQALGDVLCDEKSVSGLVNVPADCATTFGRVALHAARPAGVNEPRPEGVVGAARILKLVESANPDDLVICLLSGGGSALLKETVEGISLEDKQAVTRLLSAAGANIRELNTVRKQLSAIKGGGLASRCQGVMITLIISDVIGDPLDVIASGPTVEDSAIAADALRVLRQFQLVDQVPPSVIDYLKRRAETCAAPVPQSQEGVLNFVIANNALAVDSAGIEAERRGYSHAMWAATDLDRDAESVGIHLADMTIRMQSESGPDCLITGGEPTVTLVPEDVRGKGGRNQQLVLAAMQRLIDRGVTGGFAILSGGTDGEDGPTDAAGAICGPRLLELAAANLAELTDSLERNDAYHFFERYDGLLKTGPTHTNVCDIRVALVDRIQPQPKS